MSRAPLGSGAAAPRTPRRAGAGLQRCKVAQCQPNGPYGVEHLVVRARHGARETAVGCERLLFMLDLLIDGGQDRCPSIRRNRHVLVKLVSCAEHVAPPAAHPASFRVNRRTAICAPRRRTELDAQRGSASSCGCSKRSSAFNCRPRARRIALNAAARRCCKPSGRRCDQIEDACARRPCRLGAQQRMRVTVLRRSRSAGCCAHGRLARQAPRHFALELHASQQVIDLQREGFMPRCARARRWRGLT